MGYTKVLMLAKNIGEDLRKTPEVIRYKTLEEVLITSLKWQKYHEALKQYEADKNNKEILIQAKKEFQDENYQEYIRIEQKINHYLGDINERIARAISVNISYLNQIGIKEGGKDSCSKENH
ncbi:MAG: YlbF family regulator [Erysipelotrichales bacterium]|nr:YlbF family regulator [Erysipelotrichales bacterium]